MRRAEAGGRQTDPPGRKNSGRALYNQIATLGRREPWNTCYPTADADWSAVEPAIFGTLLERALDARDRERLGGHFTPGAYVERLVLATIIEPLCADCEAAKAAAVELAEAGDKRRPSGLRHRA